MPQNPLKPFAASIRRLAGHTIWSRFSRERDRTLALAVVFSTVVLLQAWAHMGGTQAGRPYEGWDEIATFNTAYVVSGPTAGARTYRYGSIDTAIQWAAIKAYEAFDPVGRAYPHLRYANYAPPSWDDPYIAFKDKTWSSEGDYNYFRGVDDHQPIFISRQIHLAFAYGVLLAIGLAAIWTLGTNAIFVLPPLLLLTAGHEAYFQMTQSLPNGINALITFGIVASAMLYADQKQLRYLLASVGLLAIGMNFKPDILIVCGAPGLALYFVFVQCGWRVALRAAIWASAVMLAATLVTRPLMLLDPLMDLRVRYHVMMNVTKGGNFAVIMENWRAFLAYLNASLVWRQAIVGPLFVAGAALAVLATAAWKRTTSTLVPLIAASVFIVTWAVPILKVAGASDRYFLNGLAAFFAMIAACLVLAARRDRRWRTAAQVGALILTLDWGAHIAMESASSLAIAPTYAKTQGFDPTNSRTLASLDAIRLAKSPGFRDEVLIDQHAYIDLRLFRLNGINVQYVNMDTLGARLATLDSSHKSLVVFAPGSYDRSSPNFTKFEVTWSADLSNRYDLYLKRLTAMPVVARRGRLAQRILSGGPLDANDEIIVAVAGTM